MSLFQAVIPEGKEAQARAWQFSPGVRWRDVLFISGAVGVRSDGTVPEDPAEQFACVFESIGRTLGAAGASFANLVEITSYHRDLNAHMATFLEVKARYLPEPYAAWTAIGVAELGLPGGLVEVRGIAVLG